MISKKIILVVIFFVFITCISLCVIDASNISEPIKNNQKDDKDLKEKNEKLTILEQMQKLDVFKEKCKDVLVNPDSYYSEVVNACR